MCLHSNIMCLHNVYDSFFEQSAGRVTKLNSSVNYSEECYQHNVFPIMKKKLCNNFKISFHLEKFNV